MRRLHAASSQNRSLCLDACTRGCVCTGVGGVHTRADIWSTDMLLAAELERTATPSRVHISEATKKLLNPSHFRIDPADPVLDETNGRLVARYMQLGSTDAASILF